MPKNKLPDKYTVTSYYLFILPVKCLPCWFSLTLILNSSTNNVNYFSIHTHWHHLNLNWYEWYPHQSSLYFNSLFNRIPDLGKLYIPVLISIYDHSSITNCFKLYIFIVYSEMKSNFTWYIQTYPIYCLDRSHLHPL